MTTSQANSKLPPRFSAAVARGLREGAAISLGVVALVMLVALLSFDPRDPGFFFHRRSATSCTTGSGSTGAYLADFLFFLFGQAGLPAAAGARRHGHSLRARPRARPKSSSRVNMLVRLLGFVVLLLCSCALTGLHWSPGVLRQGAGGVVGMALGNGLASGLNLLGATLILLAAWAAGVARGLWHFVAARHRWPGRRGVARHPLLP